MQRRKFLVAASGAALFTGCSKIKINGGAAAPIEVWFHLFDASKSVKNNRQKYEATFLRLTECLKEGTRIIAEFITENPLSDASYPINEFIPLFDPVTDNRVRFNARLQQSKQNLKQKFGELFSLREPGKFTPIIDSLVLAESVYARYPGTKKRLVIFSDMIESSKRAQFEKMVPSPEAVLKAFQADRPLPDLSRVEVIVVGANTNGNALKLYYQVEQFWRGFFKHLGATVTEYGAGLIDCPR